MIKFTLPITPTAQARPRFSRFGTHKSKTQLANERTLEAWLLEYVPKEPLIGPLVLEFVAALPVGLSDSKKTVQAKLSGDILPTKKPDLDNLAKQLKDTMTRMQFFKDDSQIVSLHCEKIYAPLGYWEIAIYSAVKR